MADKMMRVAGRSDTGLAKPIQLDSKGNLKTKPSDGNISVVAEYTLQPGALPANYDFITSKLESNGNHIKISGYKYMDLFIIAEQPHAFAMSLGMYQRILPIPNSNKIYKGGSDELGLSQANYADFVRDFKLSSGGGETCFIKEMRVFGNYFLMSLGENKSAVAQNYIMMINLYN